MKKIVIISAIFIFAAAIGLGIYSNQNETKGSDLISFNIEALADTKGGMANRCCPIWNVSWTDEVIFSVPPAYKRTKNCTTGGEYKCDDCDCSN